MGRRGRASAAALQLVPPSRGSLKDHRPAAPPDLSPEQAAEWQAIVARCPADWFPRETFPLLSQYCRLAVSVRRLGKVRNKIECAKRFDLDTYERVSKLLGRDTQLLASLATKMRLSQHATYDKKKSKGPILPAPWED